MLLSSNYERYSRQILLPGFGEDGQHKLSQSKVLVIGAGGLGCPVLQYLTAAGAGTIGIADDDVVSLSNLHRQILYGIDDIGQPKANTAAKKLSGQNVDVRFEVIETRITNANAWDIISRYDLVIDGSDNFSTRYLANDVCVLLKKPLIYGSIFRFEGQVAVFNVNGSANYRDVFAKQPGQHEVPDCAEAGVIGVLPGIIGSMMANEAIKLIARMGSLLVNKLLTYNCLYNTFYEIDLKPALSQASHIPASREAFEAGQYEISCSAENVISEISPKEFNSFISQPNTVVIDVREHGEEPVINGFQHLHRPLTDLRKSHLSFHHSETIVIFCSSGKRSKEAAAIIQSKNPECRKIFSLKGGISAWRNTNLHNTDSV